LKKFKFSFQYLMDAHESRAQAAEHALHEAMREQEKVQAVLDQKTAEAERQTHVLAQMVGVVKRSDFSSYHRSIDFIHREMDRLSEEVRRCAEVAEGHRAVFRKEMTSLRIMENLCERERGEWASALLADEQKQMDELAVVRWNRKDKAV
jgi:flagellar export protein FliJ